MVEYSEPSDDLDAAFAALADPTRRDIVERLARAADGAPVAVSDLAEPYAISLQAVSKHVQVLERAGLIACAKEGRVRRCRLLPDRLRDVAVWLDAYRGFWEERFAALDAYLRTRHEPAANDTFSGGDQE
jgi:DNA-binding transcriptional ArsR family regulator